MLVDVEVELLVVVTVEAEVEVEVEVELRVLGSAIGTDVGAGVGATVGAVVGATQYDQASSSPLPLPSGTPSSLPLPLPSKPLPAGAQMHQDPFASALQFVQPFCSDAQPTPSSGDVHDAAHSHVGPGAVVEVEVEEATATQIPQKAGHSSRIRAPRVGS